MSEADPLSYLEFCVVYVCCMYLCVRVCNCVLYMCICTCGFVFLETRDWHLVSFSIMSLSPLVLYLNWYAHVDDLLLEMFDQKKAKLWIFYLPAYASCLSSVCGLSDLHVLYVGSVCIACMCCLYVVPLSNKGITLCLLGSTKNIARKSHGITYRSLSRSFTGGVITLLTTADLEEHSELQIVSMCFFPHLGNICFSSDYVQPVCCSQQMITTKHRHNTTPYTHYSRLGKGEDTQFKIKAMSLT